MGKKVWVALVLHLLERLGFETSKVLAKRLGLEAAGGLSEFVEES